MSETRFPKIQKHLSDFLYEEEGTIPRSKIITVGTMLLLLTVFFADSAFAKHRSHSSHKSHSSHRSHSSSKHGSHSSHSNHSNHSNATPVPVPDNVRLPASPSSNYSTSDSGLSAAPAVGGDPNIILARFGTEDSGVVTTPAPINASSGVDAVAVSTGGKIPVISAGNASLSPGEVPATAGVLVPGSAMLEANMETVNNNFNPFIDDANVAAPPSIPASKVLKYGTQPKSNGKIVD